MQPRRQFLMTLGAGALGLATPASGAKALRGVFPIGQTPFTEADRLDLECLASEVKFCQRGGVPGFVWPQIASGWSHLSEQERLAGAETILTAGKGGRTALVIGVQTRGGDTPKSVMYARHAAAHGADAIISLPPEDASDQAIVDYYKTIGAATDLPLFAQTRGEMSVDLVVEMSRAVPTLRCVKDEAGNPLARISELRERTAGKLAVFSGNGCRTLIEEMRLGFAGHCPTTGVADLFQAAFEMWHSGKHRDAFELFGRILAFESIPGAQAYTLIARGVFRETTRSRTGGPPLDEEHKRVIRGALRDYLQPYLRA